MGFFFNTTTPENSPESTPLSIEDVDTGDFILLEDRALPYRPISINGRQRAEFTWYPGSPNATVQMLGPEEGVISLRGFWKDRFLGSTQMASFTNRATSGSVSSTDVQVDITGGRNAKTRTIYSASDLVATVDEYRRVGRFMKLSWGDLIRYGHITSFTQTWHNVHDCEWELEFSVLSQELPLAFSQPSAPVAADLAAQAFKLWGDLSDTVNDWIENNPGSVVLRGLGEDALTVQAFAKTVEADTLSWANSVNNVAQNAVSIIQTPNEVGLSLLGAISGPTITVVRTARAIADSAIIFYYQFAGIGAAVQGKEQDDLPFGLQLGQKSYATQVKQALDAIISNNAGWRSQTTDALQGSDVRSFVATEDTDLRDVSSRYYKTPDNWRALMVYNGLSDSKLVAGQVIKVPQRLDGSYSGQR